MARIYPLFSSSKGNSTFIGTEQGGILIDCGVSFRRLSAALEVNRIPLTAVQAVFITHEHSDHVSGLKLFTAKTGCPVYGQKRTLQRLCDNDKISPLSPVIDITESRLPPQTWRFAASIRPMIPFRAAATEYIHPTINTVLSVRTSVTLRTRLMRFTGCRLVLLESNYDENMLRTGPYPLYLKERILSQNGHLSNDDCTRQVGRLIERGTTHFILGHLSQDNNRPQIADSTVERGLPQFRRCKDYLLGVAPVETRGGAVIF